MLLNKIKDKSNYDASFTNFKIRDARHYWLNTEIQKCTKKNKKELIDTDNCPDCGADVMANDYHRGELVCKDCGLVLNEITLEIDDPFFKGRSFEKLHVGNRYLSEEKRVLTKQHKKDPYKTGLHKQEDPIKKLSLNQYYLFVKKVSEELNMGKEEINTVKNILKTYKLKQIHSCLKYEQVTLGICLYILRSNGYVVSYKNKLINSVGLNKIHYKVIKRNLDKLGVLE